MDGLVKGIVQKVVPNGRHGPYAVATAPQLKGSITFSLSEEVWQEKCTPEVGIAVMLGDLRQKTAGWRAMEARFFRPEDAKKAK